MPWTTLVPSTPITSAWANANVRDQVVSVFASAAARGAAMPSPAAGALTYLQDSRRVEQYTTAGTGWQLPWSLPWGVLAFGSSVATGPLASGVGGTETNPVVLRSTPVAIPANRKIRVSGEMTFIGSGAISPTMRIRRGVGTGGGEVMRSRIRLPDVFGGEGYIFLDVVDTGYTPGASVSWSFTGVDADIYAPYSFVVEDVGPNGAPA